MTSTPLTPSHQNMCSVLHLRSITYLCALLVTFVGFTQAFSGLPAASGWVKGSHHLTGSITKSPLYAVSIIQLLNLDKQTWKGMQCNSWSAVATRNSYAWAWLIWSHICVCAKNFNQRVRSCDFSFKDFPSLNSYLLDWKHAENGRKPKLNNRGVDAETKR